MLRSGHASSLRRLVLATIALFAGALVNGIPASAHEPLTAGKSIRPVTVDDSISMRLIGDDRYFDGYSLTGPIAAYSADHRKFAVVLRNGNMNRNTNEYSLLIWKTADVGRIRAPATVLTMSSSSNRAAIEKIKWLSDNATIAFLGEHEGEIHQLYTFNTTSSLLTRTTNHATNLLNFSISTDGKVFAYTAEEPLRRVFDGVAGRDGFLVTWESLSDLMVGLENQAARYAQLFYQPSVGNPRLVTTVGGTAWPNSAVSLSPNGKYIVADTFVKEVPESWSAYEDSADPRLHEWTQTRSERAKYSVMRRLICVDTETGESRILLNSPLDIKGDNHVAWAPDSGSIAISGIYLPLADTEGDERRTRQSTLFAVEISVPKGDVTKISRSSLTLLSWDANRHQLIFEEGTSNMKRQPAPRLYFRKREGRWQLARPSQHEDTWPEIVLSEDTNRPPQIVAVAPRTGQRQLLLDLNPQFMQLNFGRVETIRWESGNHFVNGGLYYPVNYIAGKRYPLVIQTHGWNPHRFWIDGAFSSGFAAQALAGKGIMVLQADEDYTESDTPSEVSREVAALESAIEYLDQRELIDKDRVGLIGFSRTGLYLKYALTKSQYHFAAASVADDVDAGYFEYVAYSNGYSGFEQFSEGVNGGIPFSADVLKTWGKRSPSFDMVRVLTPLRILAFNPRSLLGEWEWFYGLRRLGKPVEMIYMQDAEHVLERPWERVIAQQGNVDWFDFWLNGHERKQLTEGADETARSFMEQYARWERLCDMQVGQHPDRPAFCVRSKPH